MPRLLLLSVSLLALALPNPGAHAAAIDFGSSNLNGNVVNDFSGPGLLSFDVAMNNTSPILLVIELDPGESQVAWNSRHDFPTPGQNFPGYRIDWRGSQVSSQGTVRDGFDRDVSGVVVSNGGTRVDIGFDPPGESAGFTIGNPGGGFPGAIDWQLAAAVAGGRIDATLVPVTAPEPEALALTLLGLTTLALSRRRRPAV